MPDATGITGNVIPFDGQNWYESVQGDTDAPPSSAACCAPGFDQTHVKPTPLAQPPRGDDWPKAEQGAKEGATGVEAEAEGAGEACGSAESEGGGAEAEADGGGALDPVRLAVAVAV